MAAYRTVSEVLEAVKQGMLSTNEAKREIAKLGTGSRGGGSSVVDKARSLASGITGDDLQQDINEALGATGKLVGGFESLFQQITLTREEMNQFFQAGYSNQMDRFGKSIDSAYKASFDLFGSFEKGATVVSAFRDEFKAMPFVSKQFTQSLMENSVVLSGAGFEMRTFAQVIEDGVMAFNMSADGLDSLTAQLITTSKEMAIAPDVLTDNFRIAQKDFAYTSDKFMDNFVKLQKMARTTGVDFQSLATAFGSSMDTFEGSATKAGQLNQILGKSVFNSIDLLNKTEAERAETIRNEITKSGRNVEEMGKFELLALKDTLGLGSVAETRKFLRGDLKMDERGDIKKMKDMSPDKIVQMQGKDLGNAIKNLSDGIKNQQAPMTRAFIELNKSIRGKAQEIGMLGGLIGKPIGDEGLVQFFSRSLAEAMGATGKADPMSTAGIDISNLENQAVFLRKILGQVDKAEGIGDLVKIQLTNVELAKALAQNIPGLNKEMAGNMGVVFGDAAINEILRLLRIKAPSTAVSNAASTGANIVPNTTSGGTTGG